ncbi:hypothetical protein [Corynebacterium qintianiae]|uniref:hypothetical protein n=1 Tax=Corynebacterium qintianiae TaxID=2709392 RepID=UPI0013ED4BAA|nr:hypothetical protein [Corynebacterium qintianiae]
MSDLVPGVYATQHPPKPSDLPGARQLAVDALTTAANQHAQDNARFEETYTDTIGDVLRLRGIFLDEGATPTDAAILTLATIMLTPPEED